MKGRKLIAITLAAVTTLTAGCTQKEEAETMPVPLNFSTSVEAQTRGTDINTASLNDMGVLACFTQGTGFNASTSKPNFMYNEKVYKSAGNWKYDNTRYWPVNTNDKVSFFAYAPYNVSGATLSAASKTGYPEITYTVPAAEADQTDLLASTPIMDKNGGTVDFNLKHALTKVTFIVKNGDSDGTPKTVNSFSIKAKSSGKLTFNNSGFSWGNSAGTTTFTPTNGTNITVPTAQNGTVSIATFYLIPDNAGATFSMQYITNGKIEVGGTALKRTVTVTDKTIGNTPAWNAGGAVTYTITVTKTEPTVEATGSTWGEDSSSEITVTTASELKIGDYYYDDGTWSDGGVRRFDEATGDAVLVDPIPNPVLTNPETGTTRACIGIVFYTGRHSTDISTYPPTINDNIKGYVVSLTNIGKVSTNGYNWAIGGAYYYSMGTVMNQNDYNGYYNTQQIKTTASNKGHWSDAIFPLPYKVLNSYTPAAPTESSLWYMPSLGQLKDLHKYRVVLNTIMAKAGSYTMTGDNGGYYWSSTELNTSRAYYVTFNQETLGVNNDNKVGRTGTRPLLTF